MKPPMEIVMLGVSLTSSWGNGHATTYRSLARALAARGHRVLFLERDAPCYAGHRDLAEPTYCEARIYGSVEELKCDYADRIRDADLVVVGSCVHEGVDVGDWVTSSATGITAFYDLDTPVTLARLKRDDCPYLTRGQVARYDLYLSFTGGPVLVELEEEYGSPCARALYCSVEPTQYMPVNLATLCRYDLGYLGNYCEDRQPTLERLLLDAARRWPEGRFVVAGTQFPSSIRWPANVERIEHLAPSQHAAFYGAQRFTLNATRADMIARGYSPSVRLFEAAACATPVISDAWRGLHELFSAGREIVIAESTDEVLDVLRHCPEVRRKQIGQAARRRVLARHTSAHRAADLEHAVSQAASTPSPSLFPWTPVTASAAKPLGL